MTDPTVAVRAGDELDWPALESYLRGVLDLLPHVMEVRQFVAGRANLTYRVAFGSTQLVVRRPPHGVIARGAHDMAREHRVLSRLAAFYPRAPLSLHFCDDRSIIGAPFVVVEHREGVVVRDKVPHELAHHDDVERRIDIALLDAVANLHAVDPGAAALLDHPQRHEARQLPVPGRRPRRRHVRIRLGHGDAGRSALRSRAVARIDAHAPGVGADHGGGRAALRRTHRNGCDAAQLVRGARPSCCSSSTTASSPVTRPTSGTRASEQRSRTVPSGRAS